MNIPQIKWLSSDDAPDAFPSATAAFSTPDGLLAAGGDLSVDRLIFAYRNGIFPWYEDGQPILWWSPDPRCVIYPTAFHASRRLRRFLRNSTLQVRFNTVFSEVISACAEQRRGQHGTWITADMRLAFQDLFGAGWAHSIEVWRANDLVGGLYGIAIGKAFFGESMFSRETNGSKAALLALCELLKRHEFALLDCQVASQHLLSLGATLEPRHKFLSTLNKSCAPASPFDEWPTKALNIGDFVAK